MALADRIDADIKTAMKERRKDDLRALRGVKQAIQLALTDGSGKDLDDAREVQLLQKLVKQRRESLRIYEEQNRDDLAATERHEIGVIEQYLPEQLSDADLERIVATTVQQLGASSMKDMGQVMKTAQVKIAGRADGKAVSAVVRRLLSS